jgi:hypothetical protein
MTITIQSGPLKNVGDVLRRSPVAGIPGARDTMRECLFRSIEVYQGKLNGEVACVWGLIPPTLLSDAAYLWLLTTDIVAEHKFLFIRHSQRYIEEALKHWPTIYGEVIGDNPAAKKWLRFLGAEFDPEFNGRTSFKIKRKLLNG